MAFGITDDGFVIKDLDTIKTEIKNSAKAKFGDGINLREDEFLGGFIAIMAERFALLWEANEDTYNSQYPETADDANLSNVVTITGITRKGKTNSTVTVNCRGTLATAIPVGSVVSVLNDSATRFVSTVLGTIGAGTDEVQTITFSGTPTSGAFTLIFDGEETASIAWNDNAAAVQTALNNLIALSAVTVAGSFAAGFVVTFAGADGEQPQSALTEGANTLDDGGAVTFAVVETTPGAIPNVDIEFEGEATGPLVANAGSLTVIETVIAGWSAAYNVLDADEGNDDETDATLRARRTASLAFPGAGTEEALEAQLAQVTDVTSVAVTSNRTNSVDGDGRPAKSFEAVVLGGTEDDVAEEIWLTQPAGIESYGAISKTVVDSQGFNQTVKFSRPVEVPIYVIVTISTGTGFPAGGSDAIKANIIEYSEAEFSVGDDVITSLLYTPINEVEGITAINIKIGIAPAPAGSANIVIAADEISTWDTPNISVAIV